MQQVFWFIFNTDRLINELNYRINFVSECNYFHLNKLIVNPRHTSLNGQGFFPHHFRETNNLIMLIMLANYVDPLNPRINIHTFH